MRKALRFVAAAAIVGGFGIVAATPAIAGKPAPGGVYKGTYERGGMTDKMRIKVYENGTAGNWSLPCAGVRRAKFEIDSRGRYQNEYAGGASGDLVRGKGKFGSKSQTTGEITKIATNGAECAAPGDFRLTLTD